MESYAIPVKRENRRFFAWIWNFEKRERRAYPAEDRKLTPEPHQTTVDAFFEQMTSTLDPPQYSYTSLRRFLEQADENDLQKPSATTTHPQDLVLLDDRRANTSWLGHYGEAHLARNWDGFYRYPPEGANPTILLLDTQGLYKRQSRSVSSCAFKSEIL